jgi:two-component system, NarL family, invasion response regulator UvrY
MTPGRRSALSVTGVGPPTSEARSDLPGIGVLAVDDQVVFLDVAREVVGATPGFNWVGGASSGEEALAAVEQLEPQFVLLDVRMPGMDGIETARRISDSHPDVVVVLISIEESPAIAPAIEASGAVALVRKQELCPAMLRRLWQIHSEP